jgi:hypothetical protein
VELIFEVDRESVVELRFIDASKIIASRSFSKDRPNDRNDNSLSRDKKHNHENEQIQGKD